MIQLIGVYKTNETSNIYLLEFIINSSPIDVDVSSFVQKDDTISKESWQTAYDEHFLNDDGTKVIGTFLNQESLTGDKTRMVFFMYFIDLNKPLISQYGEIQLTNLSPVPDRLLKIIKFS